MYMIQSSVRFAPVSSIVRANLKPMNARALLAIAAGLIGFCAAPAFAQVPPLQSTPTLATAPASSSAGPNDAGVKAHTFLSFLALPSYYGPPFSGLYYETPATLACLYALVPPPMLGGCNAYAAKANPNGGSRAIAIVDAYDNPNAFGDLSTFNAQFGVGAVNPSSFIVVYAPFGGPTPGSCVGPATQPPPAAKTGWDIEADLDIQYSHAMAPLATLYLVEAQSNSFADMNCAVTVASGLVVSQGGGEVSMSWGSGEFPAELATDPIFTAGGVVYFASTGDGPGTEYPSVSPNVVAAGGTTTSRNPLTGNFEFENVWQPTGGGISAYESRPAYQNGIVGIVGTQRGVPDISSDANPYTGVWVFNSTFAPFPAWFIVGGTSAASPVLAGIVNAAGSFAPSSAAELTTLYGDSSAAFNDITYGTCGPYMGHQAVAGWDLCTGLGSPHTYAGK
jgi:kumamolisin